MRNDIQLDGWHVRTDTSSFDDLFAESIFFTGNGRMGLRGYPALRPISRPTQTGMFIAGFFDYYQGTITDFVNLPTPVWEKIQIDGEYPTLLSPVQRDLDLSCGKLSLTYSAGVKDKVILITEERLFSITNPALLMQRTRLLARQDLHLTVESGAELCCRNQPVPDDQVKEATETRLYTRCTGPCFAKDGFSIEAATIVSDLRMKLSVRYRCPLPASPFAEPEQAAGLRFSCDLSAGQSCCIEKLSSITTSRDTDSEIQPAPPSWSFDELEEKEREWWARKWQQTDVVIEGDKQAQTAMRYAIYQLIVNCSARDDSVNIGARGLTHTRYKGCYFWDTDLFMMPFYLFTDPQAAKSLMSFRVKTLPQAKAHAARMNGTGARYPWMVALDGSEQCETWDIGSSEVHVTADVAYALGQYMDCTRDLDFFLRGGAEALIETARFWPSRYTKDPDTGRQNLLFCKGPDEYCGITSNNLFTNKMVQHNMRIAAQAADILEHLDPEQYQRLHLTKKERDSWEEFAAGITLPRDPRTGRWLQDETLSRLEPADIRTIKKGDEASYHQVCFDRLQRYRVIKQADVLLLMTRLPGEFSSEEKKAAWQDFEPLCLHDSTLSFASHALFAAQNGIMDAAETYFSKALFLDLKELMNNTGKEGLHLACFGETWQAVVFGFAGLSFEDGHPSLSPRLPSAWNRLAFSFSYQGRRYRADITSKQSSLTEIPEQDK